MQAVRLMVIATNFFLGIEQKMADDEDEEVAKAEKIEVSGAVLSTCGLRHVKEVSSCTPATTELAEIMSIVACKSSCFKQLTVVMGVGRWTSTSTRRRPRPGLVTPGSS